MAGRGPDKKPRANKKEHILVCAMTVFSYYGYDGASLDKIALEAGVAKALIIKYYGSKENLAQQCVLDFLKKLSHEVELVMQGALTYRQNANEMAALFKRYKKELRFLIALSITPSNAHLAERIWLSEYAQRQDLLGKFREEMDEALIPDMVRMMGGLHISYAVMDDEARYDSARETLLAKFFGPEK